MRTTSFILSAALAAGLLFATPAWADEAEPIAPAEEMDRLREITERLRELLERAPRKSPAASSHTRGDYKELLERLRTLVPEHADEALRLAPRSVEMDVPKIVRKGRVVIRSEDGKDVEERVIELDGDTDLPAELPKVVRRALEERLKRAPAAAGSIKRFPTPLRSSVAQRPVAAKSLQEMMMRITERLERIDARLARLEKRLDPGRAAPPALARRLLPGVSWRNAQPSPSLEAPRVPNALLKRLLESSELEAGQRKALEKVLKEMGMPKAKVARKSLLLPDAKVERRIILMTPEGEILEDEAAEAYLEDK